MTTGITQTPNHTDTPAGNGSGIDLYITVRDKDGKIVSEQCKNGDLYLYNFAAMIASILKYALASSATKKYYVTGRDGVQLAFADVIHCSRSGSGINTGSAYQNNTTNYPMWADVGKIVVGASTAAPSINDFDLQIPVAEIVPLIPQIETVGNTLKVVITGTSLFEAQTTIAEAGLSITPPWWGSSISYCSTVYGFKKPTLITRDTFEPATIPAGGSATIRFELWFNAMPPAE